jgi:MscS family membrane protein
MQIRTVVGQMHALLMTQPGADLESVRVRFLRLGSFSLDIELFAYFYASDWNRFLEIQEGLLLQAMEVVHRAGTEIAFPSQTLHLTDDRQARVSKAEESVPTVAT